MEVIKVKRGHKGRTLILEEWYHKNRKKHQIMGLPRHTEKRPSEDTARRLLSIARKRDLSRN